MEKNFKEDTRKIKRIIYERVNNKKELRKEIRNYAISYIFIYIIIKGYLRNLVYFRLESAGVRQKSKKLER